MVEQTQKTLKHEKPTSNFLRNLRKSKEKQRETMNINEKP